MTTADFQPQRGIGAGRGQRRRDVRITVAGFSLLSASMVAGVMNLSLRLPPVSDEPHHLAQIRLLMAGEWHIVPTLTTIPGYHAAIASMGSAVGSEDVFLLRACSVAVSVCALAVIFALARAPGDGRAVERLLQVAFLPIFFPLLFLLYTDVAAILCFSLALLLLHKKRYWSAGVVSAMTLAVRQNYIVWVAFLMVLVAWEALGAGETGGFRHRRRSAPATASLSPRVFSPLLRNEAGLVVAILGFVAFTVANNGVAVGDRSMHPFPSFHLGNIYFALFLSFFLLLPLHIRNAPAIAALARRPRVVGLLAVVLPVFLLTVAADHPYNRPELNWWLHNRILNSLVQSFWAKLAMYAAAAATLLSLVATRLRARAHYLVYPSAALSVIPSWQIEQRYYLCALVLLLLFRVQHSRQFEWLFIAYLAAFSAVLCTGIAAGAYFL
jgi:alpha-1,2-glucosyltransferase